MNPWMKRATAAVWLFTAVAPTPAAAAAAAAAPAPAGAVPTVQHTPVDLGEQHVAIELEARIVTEPGSKVLSANLFYRLHGKILYERVKLKRVQGTQDVFNATIPATATTGDLEYYLEAFDTKGRGPGLAGSETKPLRIRLVAPDATPTDAKPEPRPEPKPEPKPDLTPSEPTPHAGELTARAPAPAPHDDTLGYVLAGSGAAVTLGGAVIVGLGTHSIYQSDQQGAAVKSSAVATVAAGAGVALVGLIAMRVGASLLGSDAPAPTAP